MGRYAPQAIKDAWPLIADAIPGARFSGIVEGTTTGNGYHTTRNDLRARGRGGAYSLRHHLDTLGDGDAASALDVSANERGMIIMTSRLLTAARAKDPRLWLKLRDFGGTLNGDRVTALNVTQQRFIRMDSTHLWHGHFSGHRAFVNDRAVWQGIGEVIAGIPIKGTPSKPKPDAVPAGKIMILGKLYDAIDTVDVSIINTARERKVFSRHTRELAVMLDKAGYKKNGVNNGFWSKGMQADLDAFRREEMNLKGSDAGGPLGIASLTLLAKMTKSDKKVRR